MVVQLKNNAPIIFCLMQLVFKCAVNNTLSLFCFFHCAYLVMGHASNNDLINCLRNNQRDTCVFPLSESVRMQHQNTHCHKPELMHRAIQSTPFHQNQSARVFTHTASKKKEKRTGSSSRPTMGCKFLHHLIIT